MPIANLVHLDASQRREPRHLAFTPERLKLSFTPNVSERQIRGADSPDERLLNITSALNVSEKRLRSRQFARYATERPKGP